jgi:hypothetical protein
MEWFAITVLVLGLFEASKDFSPGKNSGDGTRPSRGAIG